MFPGGAHAKYRDRHTDCRPSNLSGGFERFRLLREDGRRQVSQLPDEHDRDDFNFWVVMLHDSVDMLRTIFCESDALLFTDAVNRNGWR
jgi:hypothetical protein